MKHRNKFTQKDRQARSQLVKLADSKRLLCGSLVTMARVCGNPNCKCIREGKKHVSLYLKDDLHTEKMGKHHYPVGRKLQES